MNRLALINVSTIASVLALSSVAHAGEEGMGTERVFTVSLDGALGTYIDSQYHDDTTMMDVTKTVTQMQYFLGVRGLIWDEDKTTPLDHTPGLWIDMQFGWIANSGAPSDAGFGDDGGGGILMNMKLSGPWRIINSKHMKLGAGIGFGFGLQMGLPAGADRPFGALAADAFLLAVMETKLGGLKSVFEGEYAAGSGYNEERVYGRVGLGRWAVGGMLVAGQAGINYLQVGVNIGRSWETGKD